MHEQRTTKKLSMIPSFYFYSLFSLILAKMAFSSVRYLQSTYFIHNANLYTYFVSFLENVYLCGEMRSNWRKEKKRHINRFESNIIYIDIVVHCSVFRIQMLALFCYFFFYTYIILNRWLRLRFLSWWCYANIRFRYTFYFFLGRTMELQTIYI